MLSKYVYLDKNNEVLLWGLVHDDVPDQAALGAAFETGATFVEVPLENRATLGWYFDGTDYVQYPVS